MTPSATGVGKGNSKFLKKVLHIRIVSEKLYSIPQKFEEIK